MAAGLRFGEVGSIGVDVVKDHVRCNIWNSGIFVGVQVVEELVDIFSVFSVAWACSAAMLLRLTSVDKSTALA